MTAKVVLDDPFGVDWEKFSPKNNYFVGDLIPDDIDQQDMQEQEKERYRQDTKERRFLAHWVVWVTSCWLGLVLVIVFFVGFSLMKVPVAVLDVLLATTTVNVLGLSYIVLKGLFGGGLGRKQKSC